MHLPNIVPYNPPLIRRLSKDSESETSMKEQTPTPTFKSSKKAIAERWWLNKALNNMKETTT